jgi:iron complex outermembrane receptor protein
VKILNKFLILFYIAFLLSPLYSQIEVVVEANKDYYDVFYSEKNISSSNYKTVSEAIYFAPNVNLIHKGFPLTQAHLFINGGSFEQTGIFVDEIKINDPQTGHYNFDFPWTSLDIEEAGLIKKGTTIFGAGSLNGLLNVKLKEIEKDSFQFITDYGTYNTFYSVLRAQKKFNDGGISISTEKSFSDGYHEDTDYSKEAIFLTGSYKNSHIQLGYDEKEYGAYDYYTPGKNMPSYEQVITRYGRIFLEPFNGTEIQTYIRTHSDLFTLNRDNPSYYQNNHLNMIYGGMIKYNLYLNPDKNILLKYNWQREEIKSNKLGSHHRIKNAAIINGYFTFFNNIKANINLSLENYDVYNALDLLPSINLIYDFSEYINFSAYYSYSARYPNFTELYYQDPYNLGNSSLKPERSHETGGNINLKFGFITLSTGAFYRYGTDIIDWGKDNISDPVWQIRNIGRIITTGFNTGFTLNPVDLLSLKFDYSYLDSYNSEKYISKYGLSYLRHKISTELEINVFDFKFLTQYTYKTYIDRTDAANYLNMTISKQLAEWIAISFKVENALNYYFEEIKGIPAPGRIISGRLNIGF